MLHKQPPMFVQHMKPCLVHDYATVKENHPLHVAAAKSLILVISFLTVAQTKFTLSHVIPV